MGEFGYRLVRVQSEEKSENLFWQQISRCWTGSRNEHRSEKFRQDSGGRLDSLRWLWNSSGSEKILVSNSEIHITYDYHFWKNERDHQIIGGPTCKFVPTEYGQKVKLDESSLMYCQKNFNLCWP